MKYDPNKHHRRSIRLKGYDYSQAGLYFITICCNNRECLFGKMQNGIMELNDAGRMVEKWYRELENKYPDKRCHDMVVMPNHFHCIIENIPSDITKTNVTEMGAHVGAPPRGRPDTIDERLRPNTINERLHPESSGHIGPPQQKYNATICVAMDWFKTMTTNEYIRGVKNLGWQRFDGKLWQRNYYEHIIRDEKSYNNISEYIINNPANWKNDTLK